MTSSAKRRKEKLKERKQKKKAIKNKSNNFEEVIDFHMAADGKLRPSDRGEVKPFFQKEEQIAFGERVSRPPDLKDYMDKMRRNKKTPTSQGVVNDVESENDGDGDEKEEEMSNKKKRKRPQGNIMYQLDKSDEDTQAIPWRSTGSLLKSSSIANQPSDKSASQVGQGSNEREMERLRLQVLDAYQKVKERRRLSKI